MPRLGLRLTPHGRLSAEEQDDGPEIDAAASIRLIDAFARGTGYGLVWLGAAEVGQALLPLFVLSRDFATLYVGSLCLHASGLEAEERIKLPSIPAPTAAELSSLVLTAPIMPGAEYLTEDVLLALWDEMERAFAASLAAAEVGLQAFLTTLNRAWNLVGRVHFNLAENRRDPDQPFAFMATYTTRLSAQAKAQHVPLQVIKRIETVLVIARRWGDHGARTQSFRKDFHYRTRDRRTPNLHVQTERALIDDFLMRYRRYVDAR